MVVAIPGENIEHLIRRFRVECDRAGVIKDFRKHQYFFPPSHLKHIKNCERKRRSKLLKMRKEKADKWKMKFIKIKKKKQFKKRGGRIQ